MAASFNAIDVLVKRYIREQLYSHFIQVKPFLWFLAGTSAINLDKLGDPDPRQRHNVLVGGGNMTNAQRARVAGSYEHQFRFQKEEPDAPSAPGLDGTSPVATKFVDDLFDMAATRWTYLEAALKIRQHRIDAQMGNDNAIGALVEDALAVGFNKTLKEHQSRLVTDTMTEAEQDVELWQKYLGVVHTVSDGEAAGSDLSSESTYQYYARKDRTASGQDGLQAKVVDVADDLITGLGYSNDKVLLEHVDQLRGNDTYAGVANKHPDAGNLYLLPYNLFHVLKVEAHGVHTVFDPGDKIPGVNFPQGVQTTTASKYPVILYGSTWITYDNDITAGLGLLLTLGSWMWEVQRDYNFRTFSEGWQKKWVNDEGGQHYIYNAICAKTRLTCFQPWLNVKVGTLETS